MPMCDGQTVAPFAKNVLAVHMLQDRVDFYNRNAEARKEKGEVKCEMRAVQGGWVALSEGNSVPTLGYPPKNDLRDFDTIIICDRSSKSKILYVSTAGTVLTCSPPLNRSSSTFSAHPKSTKPCSM